MYRFQILLKPAILSADKHRLPKPTWRRLSGGNPVIFLSGKDVFLTRSLAWSRCVVISNLSHLVSSCSTCKSLKAHEREGLKRFFWRWLKSRYPVVSCDWRLWPVSGEAFLFVTCLSDNFSGVFLALRKQTCLIFSFWDSWYCGLYRFK